MLKNIALVNCTWLTLIAHISSRDVHLSDYRKTRAFLRLLPQRSSEQEPCDLFSMEISRVVNQSCRSLTFHVDGRIRRPMPADDAPHAITMTFYDVSVLDRLPNLRHISISYTDWPLGDIFEQFQIVGFPRQVTHLSLDYSFTAAAAKLPPFDPYRVLSWVYISFLRRRTLSIPNLRRLSLSRVPPEFAVIMLLVCPNVETLELTHPGQLFDLAPLPAAVRTLVLRHPGVALSKRAMSTWRLSEALDIGLFASGASMEPPRVIVRSGTPDPVAFIRLRGTCKRFDVDLVYERDDAFSPTC